MLAPRNLLIIFFAPGKVLFRLDLPWEKWENVLLILRGVIISVNNPIYTDTPAVVMNIDLKILALNRAIDTWIMKVNFVSPIIIKVILAVKFGSTLFYFVFLHRDVELSGLRVSDARLDI